MIVIEQSVQKHQKTHSSAHGTFSRTGHMLGHRASLGKFKKTEIVSSIFSDHSAMRLYLKPCDSVW